MRRWTRGESCNAGGSRDGSGCGNGVPSGIPCGTGRACRRGEAWPSARECVRVNGVASGGGVGREHAGACRPSHSRVRAFESARSPYFELALALLRGAARLLARGQ
jgi:hypothetical protein